MYSSKYEIYSGLVISKLMHKGKAVALLERSEAKEVYDITTDNSCFQLYIKYASEGKNGSNRRRKWSFNIAGDKAYLQKYSSNSDFKTVLVCVGSNIEETELVVLYSNEVKMILDADKDALNVSKNRYARKYNISMGRKQNECLEIDAFRFEKLCC